MKPKTIGIIGGAGPLAGALLFVDLIKLCQKYGCHHSADFPKIIFLNVPFSDMLGPKKNVDVIQKELEENLDFLRKNGAAVIGISCNTLHAFLKNAKDVVHVAQVLRDEMQSKKYPELPLVLCTSTSKEQQVHAKFFSCRYPSKSIQKEIDQIIDDVLAGKEVEELGNRFNNLIQGCKEKVIVLGCTELSLLRDFLDSTKKVIIEPLQLLAPKILEKSFS